MIRLGYVEDSVEVLHETVDSVPESNDAMEALRLLKTNEPIDYFYKERQTTESDWQRYAFVDPL